jgi:hypothetical protein
MPKGQVGQFEQTKRDYKPLETHTAESKWQFCNCTTCQDHRFFLDSRSPDPIDYTKFRLKGENY